MACCEFSIMEVGGAVPVAGSQCSLSVRKAKRERGKDRSKFLEERERERRVLLLFFLVGLWQAKTKILSGPRRRRRIDFSSSSSSSLFDCCHRGRKWHIATTRGKKEERRAEHKTQAKPPDRPFLRGGEAASQGNALLCCVVLCSPLCWLNEAISPPPPRSHLTTHSPFSNRSIRCATGWSGFGTSSIHS